MKVALVHEWLTTLGGSERVVWAFHRMFPEAPVYTTVHRKDLLPEQFQELDVRTSFIQQLPGGPRHYQQYLPLMPLAFEHFDLQAYDLVLTSSHACAKGVITRPDAVHVCYTHTPMRYAWDLYHEYQASSAAWRRPIQAWLLHRLRQWDVLAAHRVDQFVANSHEVAGRIRKHYRRDATVIHPPIDLERFSPVPEAQVGDHLLVLSRLVPYKRVDLAVRAATRLGVPLRVVGEGPLMRELRGMAGPSVQFLGHLDDAAVAAELASCKALLFGAHEDFGLVPLEAQAAGRPVIAYGRGGALETVVEGVTGTFFAEQHEDDVIRAIRRLDALDLAPRAIRRHAERFGFEAFRAAMTEVIARTTAAQRRGELPLVEAGHG